MGVVKFKSRPDYLDIYWAVAVWFFGTLTICIHLRSIDALVMVPFFLLFCYWLISEKRIFIIYDDKLVIESVLNPFFKHRIYYFAKIKLVDFIYLENQRFRIKIYFISIKEPEKIVMEMDTLTIDEVSLNLKSGGVKVYRTTSVGERQLL
ncbi:MAG: hypothetical protein ACJ75J_16455 [Cytophagaceae bacterium]